MAYGVDSDHEVKLVHWPVIIVTTALSSLAICLTFFFFAFNIRYRNFRLIKMSSPSINNIINGGCLLLYLCPVLNGIKSLFLTNANIASSLCMVNQWVIPLSSTIIYTAMLAKAWRIYKIFDHSPKMKKVVIKDYHLIIYIICMCSVDFIVLLLWQVFDSIHLQARYVYEMNRHTSQVFVPSTSMQRAANVSDLSMDRSPLDPIVQNVSQINTLKVIYECNSDYQEVWITALTTYKIILFMYGIYLAWIIRNVNVPSMNDAKYLLLSTYAVIVCGLGSMTLIQLLKDWPDVVQVFFSFGVIVATCTTQCLVFIPKIRLWYKRRNDDNFKISLSQVFLNPSASCYFSTGMPVGGGSGGGGGGRKGSSSAKSNTNTQVINLEDELCQLLHENTQLKNFLKEKEEIIRLLQNKVRAAKATFLQSSAEKKQLNDDYGEVPLIQRPSSNNGEPNTSIIGSISPVKNLLIKEINSVSMPLSNNTDTGKVIHEELSLNNDLRYPVNHTVADTSTEQLRNDLDEVDGYCNRVRDSISIDLSNTRRYSPLLYEYYRKQLELAKSIQCTYNIQCNTLFDAMTLMRNCCLKDYSQTVHNPEYLAIDAIGAKSESIKNNKESEWQQEVNKSEFSFRDYLAKNQSSLNHSSSLTTSNQTYCLPQSLCELNTDSSEEQFNTKNQSHSNYRQSDLNLLGSGDRSRQFKDTKRLLLRDKTSHETLNNTMITNLSSMQNTSVESTTTTSTLSSSSSSSFSVANLKKRDMTGLPANNQPKTLSTLNPGANPQTAASNKQTYV